jgi:hypothetical protein
MTTNKSNTNKLITNKKRLLTKTTTNKVSGAQKSANKLKGKNKNRTRNVVFVFLSFFSLNKLIENLFRLFSTKFYQKKKQTMLTNGMLLLFITIKVQ